MTGPNWIVARIVRAGVQRAVLLVTAAAVAASALVGCTFGDVPEEAHPSVGPWFDDNCVPVECLFECCQGWNYSPKPLFHGGTVYGSTCEKVRVKNSAYAEYFALMGALWNSCPSDFNDLETGYCEVVNPPDVIEGFNLDGKPVYAGLSFLVCPSMGQPAAHLMEDVESHPTGMRGPVMPARGLAIAIMASAFVCSAEVSAQEGPCEAPEPFYGFWGGGQVQVREAVAGIPVLATTRFSYREIRYSPCASGTPVLPPGVGEASISVGVPLFNNRRGGWLMQVAARGQGSQRPNEPLSGLVTGAPATAGHLNLWETPVPLIQLTGAASAAIMPRSRDAPLSIAYLGGVRVYALYEKRAQANLGIMIGGTNAVVNVVPSLAFRVSDLAIWHHRMAIGFELRSPIELVGGPVPLRWRLWGALTLALDRLGEGRSDRARGAQTPSPSYDLVRSSPEAGPPTQTAWEMTL